MLSWQHYLGKNFTSGETDVPCYAAPARAKDLSRLPSAYISTMAYDPLRDEGALYAQRLIQAGVSTELHTYPGTFHGSRIYFPDAKVSLREWSDLLGALARGLGVELKNSQ